jgi:integrase
MSSTERTAERGRGRIFQPKGRKVLMLAYYGPRTNGAWGEIRESAHTEDPEKAQRKLDRRLREVANHREGIRSFQGPSQERLTVGELLDALERDYQTREIKGLRQALGHFRPVRDFFGHEQAVAVTPDRIRLYLEKRRKDGRSNATINRETEVLRRAYTLAGDERRLAAQFIPKVARLSEKGNARQGFFERHEIEQLLPHLPDPLDDMTQFAAICGWRLGEILELRWEWIDRAAREIRLPDSKNGEGRTLPLDGADWQLIEKRWAARVVRTAAGTELVSSHVFHRNGRALHRTTFEHQWRRACTAAKLLGKIFHDLRRTAARDMVRGGAPESFVMKITGHQTTSMFRRYNIVATEDMRNTLRLRREYVEQRPSGRNVVSFEEAPVR